MADKRNPRTPPSTPPSTPPIPDDDDEETNDDDDDKRYNESPSLRAAGKRSIPKPAISNFTNNDDAEPGIVHSNSAGETKLPSLAQFRKLGIHVGAPKTPERMQPTTERTPIPPPRPVKRKRYWDGRKTPEREPASGGRRYLPAISRKGIIAKVKKQFGGRGSAGTGGGRGSAGTGTGTEHAA